MIMTHASDRTATLRRRLCSHPPILSRRCSAAAACMHFSENSRVDSGWFGKKSTWTNTKKYRCKIRRDHIRG